MGRVFAIFGDVHANLEALDAVLDDCRAQGVTDFLCTGDVVGYNACPRECLRKIRDIGCPVVKGNHDHYVSSRQDLSNFQPIAAHVVEWTRRQLDMQDIYWLRDLPFEMTSMGISIVHATTDCPAAFGYVFDELQADANFVQQKVPLCFNGHTHCPVVFERQMAGVSRFEPQELTLGIGRKYFINVGSVGQPRDGDPRSSYVIYDVASRTVRFRRVAYDIEGAQSRIRAAGLPERLAERLAIGQ